jgi:hypothetical protein
MYFFCQRHFPIHYEVAAFLKLMGIIILYTIIYSCIVLAGLPAGIAIPIKIILCILFPGSLFVARIFDAKEREYANNYIQRVMHFTKQS